VTRVVDAEAESGSAFIVATASSVRYVSEPSARKSPPGLFKILPQP
jgi:hypothetical protein